MLLRTVNRATVLELVSVSRLRDPLVHNVLHFLSLEG